MSNTPRRLGKYELLQRLGHGGVAEVWKALDTELQRHVALKLLQPNLRDDPNFITRFQREAQLIASLHHPNIVQIHDFQVFQPPETDQADTSPIAYMVMDYVEGGTLADYISHTSNKGVIPSPNEIINLFTSISLAIDFAHQKGMIHRDIKPANILLDKHNTTLNPMGEPILTDFGVAKMLSASSNTLSGAQLGTPLYISPEQARGYPGNERSDLYSLGVVLYEIVTGALPFRGDTPMDVLSQHINAMPIAPALINPKIPPALTQVIMRSLAKESGARFPTAASLTAALAESLHLPIPVALGQPAYPLDSQNMPTLLNSASSISTVQARPLPSSGPTPSSNPQTPSFSGQQYMSAGSNTPNLTPVMLYSTAAQAPAQPPPSAPPLLPATPPQASKKRRTGLYIALTALLLLVLLTSGLAAFRFLPPLFSLAPTPLASTTVGRAFYVSSGQLDPNTAQGIADQLQIDLQNIPPPQAGKSYYLWLLPDKQLDQRPDQVGPAPIQSPLLLTNNLPVDNNKTVHWIYDGNKTQHNNLLSVTSRLLITEESSGGQPTAPSTDHTTWRYYAEISQTQIPGDAPGNSALFHIRHLFYNESHATALGLPGGLDIWLFRNTEKLLEWSVSARDNWHGPQSTPTQIDQMSQQFIRILDYLDGSPNLHVDLPSGTPLLADPTASRVSLLTVDPINQVKANYNIDPPGYIDHVQLHVAQVAKATDISPEMRQRTARILDATNRAKKWLTNLHTDAIHLFQMGQNGQLTQANAGSLLDDMVAQATYTYIGQIDPATNQVQTGVLQAHYEIQQLATLVVTTNVPQKL